MRYKKCFAGILTGTLAAGIVFSVLGQQNLSVSSIPEDSQVHGFAASPGYPGLPYPDTYGNYQWAFLNSGTYKLVPIETISVEDVFEGWIGGSKPDSKQKGPAQEADGTTLSVEGIDINIIPAWEAYEKKARKRNAVVAIVDTGVDYSHEDLWNSIWVNEDEIPEDGKDNDGNGYIDDVYGWNFYSNNNRVFVGEEDNHGTHSAGTIAAAKDGKGIVGINDPDYVKVMVVKALGTERGVGSPEAVSKAIQYAEANGAVICNLSFATSRYSEVLYQTMKNSKMLFVAAAGNGDREGQGYDIDQQPVYPAAFELDNVISVANLRMDGMLDPSSNFGWHSVDLAAPGDFILSTVPGNDYAYMSGTSMAAPMVTGVAAMLYSYYPDILLEDIKPVLLDSVKKLDSLTGKVATGGMLDASKALR